MLIVSLKSKGHLMIAKMGKHKQDDDAIFAKIYLSSEGNMKTIKQ